MELCSSFFFSNELHNREGTSGRVGGREREREEKMNNCIVFFICYFLPVGCLVVELMDRGLSGDDRAARVVKGGKETHC